MNILAKQLNAEAVYGLPEIYKEKIKAPDLLHARDVYPKTFYSRLRLLCQTNWIDFRLNNLWFKIQAYPEPEENPSQTVH